MKLEGKDVLLSDKERAIGRENYGKMILYHILKKKRGTLTFIHICLIS